MSTAIGVSLPRLATAVGKAVSEYAVLGKTPGFTADFIKNKYPSYSSFASAITHSRSGNATMTDGYGPELVTNGGFTSDSDWSKDSGWSISSGRAQRSNTGSTTYLSQSVTFVAGKTYAVSYNLIRTSGGSTVQFIGGTSASGSFQNSSGFKTEFITANSGNATLRFQGSSSFAGSIDNVSVREMPVLKWAPHNLALYSEQFDNAVWAKIRTTVAANQITAPDGTTTADKIIETAETGNHFIVDSSSVSFSVGQIGTSAVFLKAGERSAAVMQITDPSSPSRTRLQAIVDLSAGTITTQEFNSPTDIKSSITDAGNGWYLVKLSMATKAAGPMECLFGPLDSTSYTTNLPSYTGDGSSGIYAWGAHIFRSDLGGMVDNPDRGDSYVPTTSSAKYLPRIGHHVYNGSAWVNEGLLAESEARTNVLTYSNDFSQWTPENISITANDAVSPSGQEDATKITESTTGDTFRFLNLVVTESAGDYTFSAYVKKETRDYAVLTIRADSGAKRNAVKFNLTNGTFVEQRTSGTPSNALYGIQDVGNGWYRCYVSITHTSGTLISLISPNAETNSGSGINFEYVGDGSSGIYAYQAQTEAGLTPSSLTPTSGSSVTRAAETFTIPSANLPWPSPNYTSPELLTGSWAVPTGFDNTVSGTGTSVSVTGGTTASRAYLAVDSVTAGAVYEVDITINSVSSGTVVAYARDSDNGSGTILLSAFSLSAGDSFTDYVVAASGVLSILFVSGSLGSDFDATVSVREINPLSVSIAMDGRVTYADEDVYVSASFFRWTKDANDYIEMYLDTFGVNTGRLYLKTSASGTIDYSGGSATDFYDPDVLVPFDISSRTGSTFMQAAGQGNLALENTTPTALPDLDSNDLSLAYDYMGTIGTFRVWDRDIGDTGLVEATNPSLEPSLSLTFEGTGTNSFVVNDWSE